MSYTQPLHPRSPYDSTKQLHNKSNQFEILATRHQQNTAESSAEQPSIILYSPSNQMPNIFTRTIKNPNTLLVSQVHSLWPQRFALLESISLNPKSVKRKTHIPASAFDHKPIFSRNNAFALELLSIYQARGCFCAKIFFAFLFWIFINNCMVPVCILAAFFFQ